MRRCSISPPPLARSIRETGRSSDCGTSADSDQRKSARPSGCPLPPYVSVCTGCSNDSERTSAMTDERELDVFEQRVGRLVVAYTDAATARPLDALGMARMALQAQSVRRLPRVGSGISRPGRRI